MSSGFDLRRKGMTSHPLAELSFFPSLLPLQVHKTCIRAINKGRSENEDEELGENEREK